MSRRERGIALDREFENLAAVSSNLDRFKLSKAFLIYSQEHPVRDQLGGSCCLSATTGHKSNEDRQQCNGRNQAPGLNKKGGPVVARPV